MKTRTPLLACTAINPATEATGSVIWLHGLGADSNDFVPMVPELQLPATLPIRFIFPNAPLRPVTINNGYVMRAWYDITAMSIDQRIDATGIAESVKQLMDLIEHEETKGIPTQNIILAGFSQGAVIALTTGLQYAKPLGGIVALSGYFPLADNVMEKASAMNRNIPIFMAHGTADTVVPYRIGQASAERLKRENYPIDWHAYSMAHSVCDTEIHDLSTWLQAIYRR